MMQTTTLTRAFVLLTLAATTLGAQVGGGRGQRGQRGAPPADASTPATKPVDTTIVRKTPDGFVLDFQEQELRVVLSAIAEAGGLNVTLNNIPAKRITLRMGQTISKAGALDVLKGVAESNSLKVTEGPSLIRIEGTPAQTVSQQAQQMQVATQLRLYTYRLKHANATQLGPVLMNLLTGTGTTQGGQAVPNGNGGFQIFTPATPGGRGGPGGNAGGGNNAGNAGALAALGRAGGGGGAGAAFAQALQQQLFGGGALTNAQSIRIVAEESTNSLLVRATTEDWNLLQQLLASVDLRPLQVLIEVTIAQVSRTHDLNLGISGLQTKRNGVAADTQAFMPSAASARDFIFALTGGKGAVSYAVAINALETRGDVKVLSLPLVIAQNNKEAILNVGQSVPFVQTSQTVPNDPTNRVNTVQYQEVGTTLTITPTINPDGYVNLAVKQTNNSATNNVQFNAPIIDKREATTQIFIRDGQTTVIGGLSDNTSNNTTSGLPWLSRIPLIGGLLFGNEQKSHVVSELYLFLTPHIVSSDEDVDRLREAVRTGSDMLQPSDVQSHITAPGDSLRARSKPESTPAPRNALPTARPDSTRRPPEDR
jgi:type II secretory pathway component GspD/PulD (secretin)